MTEKTKETTNAIIISILVGVMMFSLGFGFSQMTFAGDLRETMARVDNAEKKFDRILSLLERIVEQNTVVIAHLDGEYKK